MWGALHKQLRRTANTSTSPKSGAAASPADEVDFAPEGDAPPVPASPVPAGPVWDDPAADLSPLPDAIAAHLDAVRSMAPRFAEKLAGLDAGQLAAIFSDDSAVLVRAPVGSGKTTVLVHRLLYLHLCQGVPLQRLALLTFTHRAADQLRQRIESLLDRPTGPDEFWLTGTFHSVARTLLRRPLADALWAQLGYRADFSILDDDGADALLAEIIATERLRVGRRAKLRQRLRAIPASDREGQGDDLGRLAAQYAQAKQARNALDFDDLISHAVALLSSLPGSPAWLPHAVLVDEMQDCQAQDLSLLHALRRPPSHFFAVGDPYQAIYGFRGSAPQIFARTETDFGCRAYALPCNYRSTRTIVDGARAVLGLQPAAGSAPGALRAVRADGDRIVVRRHHDPVAESIYLAGRIAQLHAGGIPYREIAVLFRLRAQAAIVQQALTQRGVPCIEHDALPGPADLQTVPDPGPTRAAPAPDPRPLPRAAADVDAVRLLTLHAAKGLEWRYVFLSGINQGLLPLGRGFHLDVALDAEERRLLFVGITRAKDCVEISYHVRPHERLAVGAPSDFLTALPAALVDWQVDAGQGRASSAVPRALIPQAAPAAEGAQGKPCPAPGATDPTSGGPSDGDPPSPFQPGRSVRHARYGVGVIVAVRDGQIDCDFGKMGARSFPVALCPLVPLPAP